MAAGLTSTLNELREYARGIHPAILAEGGLPPALKALARRSPVPVTLDVRTHERLSDRVEVTAYYVVSEALANAAKHARASMIEVNVDAAGDLLTLTVRDDGIGGADSARGSGLTGLKDRVDAIGGTLSVQSHPGQGTTCSPNCRSTHRICLSTNRPRPGAARPLPPAWAVRQGRQPVHGLPGLLQRQAP